MKMKRNSSSSIGSLLSNNSSHSSFSEMLESGMNTIGLSVSGVTAGVNSIGSATINTISTIGTSGGKPQEPQSHLSTELSREEFREFLCFTLAKECPNADDLEPLYEVLESESFNQRELNDMEGGLRSLLTSNRNLPAKVVGQVHTFLGLVYLELENNSSAVESFVRAVWFISRNPEDSVAIAQANHRLGLAYGRKKDYQQALELIDRAIGAYDPSSEISVIAKEDRHEFMEAQQLELLAKAGRLTKAVAEKSTQNQRASRRKRVSGRSPLKRRSSFNKGLQGLIQSVTLDGGSRQLPGLMRQSTTPASLSRENSDAALGINKKAAEAKSRRQTWSIKKTDSQDIIDYVNDEDN